VQKLPRPLSSKKMKKKIGRSKLGPFILGLIQVSRASQISQTNLVWLEIMSRSLMEMLEWNSISYLPPLLYFILSLFLSFFFFFFFPFFYYNVVATIAPSLGEHKKIMKKMTTTTSVNVPPSLLPP